jgi:hypothetical protein
MANLSVAVQNVSPSIPFWLQVLSVAVAPVIGFLGVAAGVGLNERNRRTAYFVEEKKRAYLEFINTLANVGNFWSTEVPRRLRSPKNSEVKEMMRVVRSQLETITRTYCEVSLFGSPKVLEIARLSFMYVMEMNMLVIISIAKGFDDKRWHKAAEKGAVILGGFTSAARKDLGLPALSRKTPTFDLPEEIHLEKMKDSLLTVMQERSRVTRRSRQGKESSQPKDATHASTRTPKIVSESSDT